MADLGPPDASDAPAALLARVRADDEAAFARIVRLHRAAMVRVAYVVAGDEGTAFAAVDQAWPAAWRRIDDVRDPSRLEPWLCAIAADRARDLLRRDARRAARGPRRPAAGGHASRSADPAVRDAALAAALVELAATDRAILALHHLAGLTPAEIGRATRLTPSAVTSRRDELERRLRRLPGGGAHGGWSQGAATDREGVADPQDRATAAASDLGERLRAHADLPVAPVHIDEVARRAKLIRHDERSRILSLLVAIVLGVVVISIPYLGGGATGFIPGAPLAPSTAGPTERPSPTPASPSPTPTPPSSPTSTPRP